MSANARKLREARGWTQAEAASRCGLDDRAYRQVESSRANLTLATLARVARGFDADVVALLEPAEPLPRRRPGRPPMPLPDAESVLDGATERGAASLLIGVGHEPTGARGAAGEEVILASAPDELIRARRVALASELERLDAMLASRGATSVVPDASEGSRVVPSPVTLPPGGWSVLRDFVLALLAANPRGLLAGEVAEAARSAKFRPRDNEIHTVLHGLARRRVISREGRAGSFVYRLRPTVTE